MMAAPSFYVTRASRSPLCSSCLGQFRRASLRYSSSEAGPPPLLAKMKQDMKAAMRAKDTARLNVLRSIISETNQLASGPNPVKSDLQILAMLKKRKAASQTAAKEFESANRMDLKEKEELQITVLDDYAGSIQLMSVEDLKAAVVIAIASLGKDDGSNQGKVMKELLKPGGALDGKPIDRSQLATVVKESLSSRLG